MSPIVDLILVFIRPVFLGLIGRVLLFALLSFIINSEGDAHHLTTTLQRYIVLLLSSFIIEVLSHLRLCGLYFSTHLYLGLWILSLHTKHATTAASAASFQVFFWVSSRSSSCFQYSMCMFKQSQTWFSLPWSCLSPLCLPCTDSTYNILFDLHFVR